MLKFNLSNLGNINIFSVFKWTVIKLIVKLVLTNRYMMIKFWQKFNRSNANCANYHSL